MAFRRYTRACVVFLALAAALLGPGSFANAQKLTLFTMPHAGNPTWYEAGAKRFMEANPGVEVEVVSGWLDKLVAMVAGGTPPDVITYTSSNLPELAAAGILMDLTEWINQEPAVNLDDYLPNAVEALKFRGRQFGLPRQWSVVGLQYNVTRFNERGVAPPDDSWTWDDLLENARKLTYSISGQDTPDHYGFVDAWNANHHRYPIWVWQAGGEFWNEDYTESTLNTPEAIAGLRFYYDLFNTYNVAPGPWVPGFSDRATAFSDGRVAMTHETRYSRPSHDEYQFGVAPLAAGPAGRWSLLVVDFAGVARHSQHPDLAWKLATFLASEEGFDAGMEIRPMQNYHWGLSPFRLQALRQLEEADDIGDHYWLELLAVGRPAPTYHPAGFLVSPDLNRVVSGEISLEALVEQSVQIWNAQIREAIEAGLRW